MIPGVLLTGRESWLFTYAESGDACECDAPSDDACAKHGGACGSGDERHPSWRREQGLQMRYHQMCLRMPFSTVTHDFIEAGMGWAGLLDILQSQGVTDGVIE